MGLMTCHMIWMSLLVQVVIWIYIGVSAESQQQEFQQVHGSLTASTKPDMMIIKARSRIHCVTRCTQVIGCGGINWQLGGGSGSCSLKQGRSGVDWILPDPNTQYYEMTNQESAFVARDCADLQSLGVSTSGVYSVNLDPDGVAPRLLDVYCDMVTDGGGWTILLRRQDGSENFNRVWADYREGFGVLSGEFWLGLENMHTITSNGKQYLLRVDLTSFPGEVRFASYDSFNVTSETSNYILNLGNYSGDAGDSFATQNRQEFSTSDRDNDQALYSCAGAFHCGFWFNACSQARLTGEYGENVDDIIINITEYKMGLLWDTWLSYDTHPRYADMKIRPV